MTLPTLTLEQRRTIDLLKERLAPAAEKLMNDARVTELEKLGHSQFRNLIALASETESPAVVINFIKYLMGKDDKRSPKNWSQTMNGSDLGTRLLAEIEHGTIETTFSEIEDLKDPATKQLARMELIRNYLGFASRYMKYLEFQKERSKEGKKQ